MLKRKVLLASISLVLLLGLFGGMGREPSGLEHIDNPEYHSSLSW